MSTIDEKLKTFQELSAQIEQLEKELQDGAHQIESLLTDLNSNGTWQDPHVSNFKSSFLNYYNMSILTAAQALKEANDFLQHKHQSLSTHRNS